jgi:predicted O-linked N-acetylglucosamine transferase (SPINDLY family)
VAIVSGFFRQHSNWKIPIKGWLSRLDRRRFRLFGYYTADEGDAETAAAAALCERFVRGPLTLDAWRQAILADAPHVILYPEVGMDRVSAQLAAQRLAPVQCNAWGHPDTSGLPTLDYYLSSDLMEPPDGAQHYTERLVRLPNLSIYYEPPDGAPAAADRATLGLRPGATVFWCAQSLPKYLPQYDQVFPRIAREAGDCQFTFIQFPGGGQITALFRERLDRAFAGFGLNAADHCVFLPRLEPQKFVAAIGACDAVLDSIGWSGCNSTLEAIAAGLPIVTLATDLMRGRHTAAILRHMGVADMIANDTDDYVARAIELGRNRDHRRHASARLSEARPKLYRDDAPVRALEDFIVQEIGARRP